WPTDGVVGVPRGLHGGRNKIRARTPSAPEPASTDVSRYLMSGILKTKLSVLPLLRYASGAFAAAMMWKTKSTIEAIHKSIAMSQPMYGIQPMMTVTTHTP